MNRRAKIVATIGPASQDEAVIERLLLAGMNVARLNFSHGDHESHSARISTLRAVAKRLGRSLAILQDLQGPKIRVGILKEPLLLVGGKTVSLYPEGGRVPAGDSIPVDFPQLFDSVEKGDQILLDDGRLALKVTDVKKALVTVEVKTGGTLNLQ